MIGRLLIRGLRGSHSEGGVMMLLTLVLCLFVLVPSVIVGWQMAYLQAAQSKLSTTAVAAAYAAAEQIQYGSDATNGSAQLPFDCGPTFDAAALIVDPHCTQGRTADAARAVFTRALTGEWGLTYNSNGSGSVKLADENWQPLNGVLAYEISLPSGAAARLAAPGCQNPFQPDPDTGESTRVCWINPAERNSQPQVQFVSGVVVNATATVKLPQGCSGRWCLTVTLHVSESSAQAQQPTATAYP